MATPYITFLLLALLTTSSMAADHSNITSNSSKSHELETATQEMARANYFTFVTLINMMSPLPQTLQQNVTFLMPNDRILSATMSISPDFLLCHSIPSPLLFDHLEHIPSGSTIPSSDSGFKFSINNNGRRSFFLNNVRLTSPNLCTEGNSIRCHGIDGVILAAPQTTPPSCPNSTTPVVTAVPPAPALAPAAAPQPIQHVDLTKTSSGSCMSHIDYVSFSFVLMLIMGFII